MRAFVMIVAVALAACVAVESNAKPSPSHTNARDQLPTTASDNAAPSSKTLQVVPLPTPPILPPLVAQFTGGQSSGSSQAEIAIAEATTNGRRALAGSTTISTIRITATRRQMLITPVPPSGRAADMEITRWRFTDRYGRFIGNGTLLCRWSTATRRLCWGEARLPRGKLVMVGSSQTRTVGEFAVIGGTGVYVFKQGMLSFSALSSRKYAVRILLA